MSQWLAGIGFDGLDLGLAAGDQLVFEAAAIVAIAGICSRRCSDITSVSAITCQTGARIISLTVSGESHSGGVAGTVDLIIPINAINRVIGHQLANDADDIFLGVRRAHIQSIV